MNLRYHSVVYGILALLAVVFALPAMGAAADSNYRVYADSVAAGQGEDIAVRFNLSNQYAITSLTVPLTYNPDLIVLKSVSFTGSRVAGLANKLVTPADISAINGHFMVSAFTLFENPVPAGDGLVFTLVFTIKPSAQIGTTTVIDTLFYPPGGGLVVVRADQPGAVEPLFQAGKITVGQANRGPVFVSLPDQYVLEGDSLSLLVKATDPDDDNLTLAITSKPVGAAFTDYGNGTARLGWVPDYVGPNSADGSPKEIIFWASDGDLATKLAVKVYILDRNRPPLITGPTSVAVEAGDPLQFTVSAIDPDFETLSWTWPDHPDGAQFDGANPGLFVWQPALTDYGTSLVRFVASDPQGLTDTLDVQVDVRAVELYTVSIDSVSGLPGETVDFSVRLDNKFPITSFNVLFNADASVLSLESLGAAGTRAETFEYFAVTHNDKNVPGNVRVYGIADVGGNGTLAVGDGPIATGQIRISGDIAYAGLSVPLYFQYQDAPANNDNTLTDSIGVKIPHTAIYHIRGNVQIEDIGDVLVGDINLNKLAAEIGDVIYFTNFFINPTLYSFNLLQYANSDVNQDGLVATVSDLVALINWVVSGKPPSSPGALSGEPEAAIWQTGESLNLEVGYESDVDLGGALLTFRTTSPVQPEMIRSLADDMNLVYNQSGGEVHILMYSMTGATIPAGRSELIDIHGLDDLSLVSVQLGSADGRLVQTAFETTPEILPAGFSLAQNYPNPFNPETVIEFTLPEAAEVELSIFNVLGQRVRGLISEVRTAGEHRAVWNGCDDQGKRVSSGVYFYRLTAGANVETRKMMLLK